MSSITTDQGIVHYEVHGRGRPVILLHGWLGSWGLWQETMEFLAKNHRTYALDFWGFGESGKKRTTYAISDFVSLVDQFMEQLGIVRAPLVGHSMGGTVSLSVAIQYPSRVSKVVVIGAPIVGSSMRLILKLAGIRPIAFLVFRMLWALEKGIRLSAPFITIDERWPDMIESDLSKTTLESFLNSIASLRNTDLRDTIHKINVPIMGIYGDKDVLVDPNQWKLIAELVPDPHISRFPGAGHFPMLDQPRIFMNTLQDFLDMRATSE